MIGSTMFVGFNGGNPFNHTPVFFFSGSPKKYGSMYWSGFRHLLDIMHTGFSIAMRSQSAFANRMKNATASSLSLSFGEAVFILRLKPLVAGKGEIGARRMRDN